MNFQQLTSALTGTLNTNGWDAVCAMNAANLNQAFFQQYMQRGPMDPAKHLATVIQDQGNQFWLLDMQLGPPLTSFPPAAGAQQCQLQMFVTEGVLLQLDLPAATIQSAVVMQAGESWLNGMVDLSAENATVSQLGAVMANLASNAWQPTLTGVDPRSIQATQIGLAVQNYFANNAISYALGTVALTANLPPSLRPVSFQFVTQTNPEAPPDGCVLLLIQTTGRGGTQAPLPIYPVPDGTSTSLLVANPVIFRELLPPALFNAFANQPAFPFQAAFDGQGGPPIYGATCLIGAMDLDPVGNSSAYSSDSFGDQSGIQLQLTGMSVSPGGQGLAVSWNTTFSQYFTYYTGSGKTFTENVAEASNIQASYSVVLTPSVDSGTDTIAFPAASGTATVTQNDPPKWWDEFFGIGGIDVPANLEQQIAALLDETFAAVTIPSVSVLALECLLFPVGELALSQAAAPGDLLAAGQVAVPMAVAPSFHILSAGGQQALTALLNGAPYNDVLWEATPASAGSIDNGVYTASAAVSQAVAVTVRAIDRSNTSQVGYAMILVAPATGSASLEIGPPGVILTAGQSYTLSVTSNGAPANATVTLTPDSGSIDNWTTGQYTYTAPASIGEWQTVTVSASLNDPPASAGVDIQLAPVQTVTLSAQSASAGPGQTVALTATAANGFVEDVGWALYPTGAGSVEWTGVLQATYTAPANIDSPATVTIVAYGIGPQVAVGAASLTIHLLPSLLSDNRRGQEAPL